MKQIAILIAFLLLMAHVDGAETLHGNITPVQVGEVVMYDGFLVDAPQMKHFRQINEEKKLLEDKTIKLEELGIREKEAKDWYKNNYYEVKKKYEWQQTKSFWVSTLYFLGGAVLTGAVSYATVKTIRK